MTSKPKRLAPRADTLRELFLKSGNQCAFPGCSALLIDQDGTFVSQICHIEAAEPGGERFNPDMTNEERRAFSNLVLLCYPHHQLTNDVSKYTVDHLKSMKESHERRFSSPNREVLERIEKLNWRALVSAGVVAGLAIDDLARCLADVLTRAVDPKSDKPTTVRAEIEKRLRFAPRGTILWYSATGAGREISLQVLAIFGAAGWRLRELAQRPTVDPAGTLTDDDGVMLFAIGDRNQLSNARDAILDALQLCGFTLDDRNEAPWVASSSAIRFLVSVVEAKLPKD